MSASHPAAGPRVARSQPATEGIRRVRTREDGAQLRPAATHGLSREGAPETGEKCTVSGRKRALSGVFGAFRGTKWFFPAGSGQAFIRFCERFRTFRAGFAVFSSILSSRPFEFVWRRNVRPRSGGGARGQGPGRRPGPDRSAYYSLALGRPARFGFLHQWREVRPFWRERAVVRRCTRSRSGSSSRRRSRCFLGSSLPRRRSADTYPYEDDSGGCRFPARRGEAVGKSRPQDGRRAERRRPSADGTRAEAGCWSTGTAPIRPGTPVRGRSSGRLPGGAL